MFIFPMDFFATASFSGAFGGFIGSININRQNTLSIPFVSKKVNLGFLGDMLIGIGASLSVQFVADALLGIHVNKEGTVQPFDYMKLIAFGVLAGVAGNRLLTGLSQSLLRKVLDDQAQLENKVEKMEQINQLMRLGESDLRESRYDAAISVFSKLIELDEKLEVAYVYLGKALKRQALISSDEAEKSKLLKRAIEAINAVLELNRNNDRALYNRACYKCLAEFSKDKILPDLAKAIEIFEPYKTMALSDPDLKRLHDDPEFIKLVTM